jgi:hypothetical protein
MHKLACCKQGLTKNKIQYFLGFFGHTKQETIYYKPGKLLLLAVFDLKNDFLFSFNKEH